MQIGLIIHWFCIAVLTGVAAPETRPADRVLAGSARLAEQRGQYDLAEKLYLEGVERTGRQEIAAALGEMYERLGEIESAARMYERALAGGEGGDRARQRIESRLDICRRQRTSLVRFPVSIEAETETRQFESLLAARQWEPAFTTLGRIIEKFNGTFLQRGSGQYVGVWAWARSLLDAMPEEGRGAYRVWVSKAWAGALTEGSAEAYLGFISDRPASVAAGPAVLAWADTLADEGRIPLALGLLSRSEVEPAGGGERRLQWAAQTAPAPMPESRPAALTVPGAFDSGWPIPLDPAEQPGEVGVAAAEGRVFIYRRFRVEAREQSNGRMLWRYQPVEPADRRDVRRETYGRSRTPRSKWAGTVDPPVITACPAGVLIVEIYESGNEDRVVSVVTCLDPENGAVRWSLADQPLFDRLRVCSEPAYAGGKVFITAASRGEYPEFWLCALDGRDGRVLWRKTIATSATPTRCVGRGLLHAGWSGPTLAIDGQVVYYATHMGAVAAVDRDLGQLLWAVSYPRIPRCGPLSDATIPLLERRTAAIGLTPAKLVILPRDVNGLLVLDRATGRLERTIRSLDLTELIAVTDELAVVSTLAGEVRACPIREGGRAWSWSPPVGEVIARPIQAGRELLVPHGRMPDLPKSGNSTSDPPAPNGLREGALVARLDMDTGKPVGESSVRELPAIRRADPAGSWVVFTAGALRILGGSAGASVVSEPAPPAVACARVATVDRGWRHDAFIAAQGAEARMVFAKQEQPMLVVADASGLSAYVPLERYARRWWRPFDVSSGIWTASSGKEDRPMLACSEDGEQVRLIDAATGAIVAADRVGPIVPLKSLHVTGRNVLAAGASTLAMVQAAQTPDSSTVDGRLKTVWRRDFSPGSFAGVFAGEPVSLVWVQPGAGEPGRLLHIETATGRIIHSFAVVAPEVAEITYGDRDTPERFPLKKLRYDQNDLLRTAQGYEVSSGGEKRSLKPGPIRLLGEDGGCFFLETLEYWGTIRTATGSVTLLAPDRLTDVDPQETAEEKILRDWLGAHPGIGRDQEPEVVFEAGGLRFVRGASLEELKRSPWDWLERGDGGLLMLGGIRPLRITLVEPWLLVTGSCGVAVLHQNAGMIPAPPGQSPPLGKVPADLFAPSAVRPIASDRLSLDGDVSEWPTDGWHSLSPESHLWPTAWTGPAESAPRGAFQWAIDASDVWLSVRVEESRGEAGRMFDPPSVDVLLSGHTGYEPHRRESREDVVPVIVSLAWEDAMPVGRIRLPKDDFLLARPVGTLDVFASWWTRRQGPGAVVDDRVAVAATRADGAARYELRIDRSFFSPGEPKGFDLRINSGRVSLEWGGAIRSPAVFPMAPFLAGTQR